MSTARLATCSSCRIRVCGSTSSSTSKTKSRNCSAARRDVGGGSAEHGVVWQEGYFDHRLRDDERGEQLSIKMDYIRQNSVAAGLCVKAEDWPWIIANSSVRWIGRSAGDAK